MLFSKRAKIETEVANWFSSNFSKPVASITVPFNVITALDSLGYLREYSHNDCDCDPGFKEYFDEKESING